MNKLPTKDQLRAYLRADETDMDRPDWDAPGGILEACEEPVAQAYRALGVWRDDPADRSEEMPSLEDVIGNAMATDHLVFASDEQKREIEVWVLENYDLPD